MSLVWCAEDELDGEAAEDGQVERVTEQKWAAGDN
jgi:hypothetical protein